MSREKIKLTEKQGALLWALISGPKTTNDILNVLEANGSIVYRSWDLIHSSMRRMEDRGLVRRASENPIHWELTSIGRKAAQA